MVAEDADRADLGEPGDDAVRLRAIADDVPELPYGIDRTSIRQDRIECHEVAVDVRQDGDPHRRSA